MKAALSGEFQTHETSDGETSLSGPQVAGMAPKAAERSRDVKLQAVLTPASGIRQESMHDALHLLATWAVRAAREPAGTPHSDLTVRPPEAMNAPQSHQMEKTPCQ